MTARTLKSRNLPLEIHGELRHGMGVAEFRPPIDRALAGGQGSEVVLYLETVESVDSSATGRRALALRRVSAPGGRLTLWKPLGKSAVFLPRPGSATFSDSRLQPVKKGGRHE